LEGGGEVLTGDGVYKRITKSSNDIWEIRRFFMARRGLVIIVALCMVMCCLNGIIFAAEEEAEELKVTNRIVRISAKEGAVPSNLTSEPGTTVIWVNNARSILEVLFLDKKVTLACGSPVNFFVGENFYPKGDL
jgi:hypothetical protein